jgi:hypothetical protein
MLSNSASLNWVSATSVLHWCSTFLLCTLHVLAHCFLCLMLSCLGFVYPGHLVYSRLHQCPSPSPHLVRTTCMQLLPLVEMYCRWELQEDCSNLVALLERFEDVPELESHALGRSLLLMVRDDDDGLRSYYERQNAEPLPPTAVDAFDVVRQRLAAVDLAFQGLQPQVLIVVGYVEGCPLPIRRDSVLGRVFFFLLSKHCLGTSCAAMLCSNFNTIPHSPAYPLLLTQSLRFQLFTFVMFGFFGSLYSLCGS